MEPLTKPSGFVRKLSVNSCLLLVKYFSSKCVETKNQQLRTKD
jgi:hypothetical protein